MYICININTLKMKTFKKIGILLGVGGVIAVGLYFLRKSKPTIANEQLANLSIDTISSIEEKLTPTPTIDEQLQIDKCLGLSRLECEQKIAELDKQTAIASGNPIVSTYVSDFAPRTSTASTRDGISYNITPASTTSTPRTTTSNPRTTISTPRVVSTVSGGRRF